MLAAFDPALLSVFLLRNPTVGRWLFTSAIGAVGFVFLSSFGLTAYVALYRMNAI